MSASSRTFRVITSRIAPLSRPSRSRGSAGSNGGGGSAATHRGARARPQRQVDLRAQLGEVQRIFAVARGELLADLLGEAGRPATRLLVLHQALRELLGRIHAQ